MLGCWYLTLWFFYILLNSRECYRVGIWLFGFWISFWTAENVRVLVFDCLVFLISFWTAENFKVLLFDSLVFWYPFEQQRMFGRWYLTHWFFDILLNSRECSGVGIWLFGFWISFWTAENVMVLVFDSLVFWYPFEQQRML